MLLICFITFEVNNTQKLHFMTRLLRNVMQNLFFDMVWYMLCCLPMSESMSIHHTAASALLQPFLHIASSDCASYPMVSLRSNVCFAVSLRFTVQPYASRDNISPPSVVD